MLALPDRKRFQDLVGQGFDGVVINGLAVDHQRRSVHGGAEGGELEVGVFEGVVVGGEEALSLGWEHEGVGEGEVECGVAAVGVSPIDDSRDLSPFVRNQVTRVEVSVNDDDPGGWSDGGGERSCPFEDGGQIQIGGGLRGVLEDLAAGLDLLQKGNGVFAEDGVVREVLEGRVCELDGVELVEEIGKWLYLSSPFFIGPCHSVSGLAGEQRVSDEWIRVVVLGDTEVLEIRDGEI